MNKEYKYKIELNDFLDFQLHYLRTNSQIKSSIKKTVFILTALYLIVFLAAAVYLRENISLIIAAAVLISIFSIAQIKTYGKRFEKKITKRIYEYAKSGKLDSMLGEKTLTVWSDKLVFSENGKESVFEKSGIKNIDSSDKSVFIYTDETSAIIVPKSCLNEEDLNFLLSYKTFK